ncbi:helix-turn-helix domain-containing protein [Acidithiobacillus sp.]|uniref:helix-turn-helix domain-containing protein n=1 Tax=Acidithiobacillus sp. TaxID=1872118 RepID=UPI003D00816D
MERIDVRKLTVEGRDLLRQMVVRLRQQSGMRVEDLAKVSGAHPSTIRGWLARAKRDGTKSLEPRKSSYGPAIGKIVAGGDHGDPVI